MYALKTKMVVMDVAKAKFHADRQKAVHISILGLVPGCHILLSSQ